MIVDLNKVEITDPLGYDIVIIGSGPAGITAAQEFLNSGYRVALAEGGGEYYSKESAELLKGKTIGDKYLELDAARQRFFGGTSNHWSGWCRPLDDHDFLKKSYVNASSWPIKKTDLDPYLKKASEILEIDPFYNDEILDDSFGIKKIEFKFSTPVRFGPKYKGIFREANLDLFLNANLVDLKKISNTKFQAAIFRSFSGNTLEISAKYFILATGGIENSRLMLALNNKNNYSLFNRFMPIGKFWMEHPEFIIGEAILARGWENRFLCLTGSKQRKLKILNCGIRFDGLSADSLKGMIKDLACYAPQTGKRLFSLMERDLLCGAIIRAAWEQEPIQQNRVAISRREIDFFGLPKVELHYKKTNFDKRTVYKTIQQIAAFGNSRSFGRVKVFEYVSHLGNYPTDDAIAGCHHMGGTRMSENKFSGVVNKDLKVHETDNFYVLGSSVFPTGGHANPTLTIVKLALRLCDHLKAIL